MQGPLVVYTCPPGPSLCRPVHLPVSRFQRGVYRGGGIRCGLLGSGCESLASGCLFRSATPGCAPAILLHPKTRPRGAPRNSLQVRRGVPFNRFSNSYLFVRGSLVCVPVMQCLDVLPVARAIVPVRLALVVALVRYLGIGCKFSGETTWSHSASRGPSSHDDPGVVRECKSASWWKFPTFQHGGWKAEGIGAMCKAG